MRTQSRAELDEIVSPELALVDPELARRARASLPNPGEKAALARITAGPYSGRAESSRPGARRSGLLRRDRGRWVVAATAAAALASVVVLTDLRVEIGKTIASAETTEPLPSVPSTTAAPPAPTAGLAPGPAAPTAPRGGATTSPRRSRPQAQAAQPQRFAWAPVAEASGYRVELFRGAVKIFQASTKNAALTIPARWRHAGRIRALQPGTYRWYVWPILGGRTAGEAVVQSRLTVGRG